MLVFIIGWQQSHADSGPSSSGPPGQNGAGPSHAAQGQHASNAAVSQVPGRSGAAVLVVPRPASFQPAQAAASRPATSPAVAQAAAAAASAVAVPSQQGSSVNVSMSGFPVDASPDAVMAIVEGIMRSRLPAVFYRALPGMTSNGFPIASLAFPDMGSAQQTVQQLDGLRHGNINIRVDLGNSLQDESLQQPPYSTAVGPSQSQSGRQLGTPPRQAACPLPSGQAAQPLDGKWQSKWRPHNIQANASAAGQARATQPFGEQANGSQAHAGQTASGISADAPPFVPQGYAAMVQPPPSDHFGPMKACVQQSSERPKVIQQICRQFTGDGWETCKEFDNLKVKLNRMKVGAPALFLCVVTSFPSMCKYLTLQLRQPATCDEYKSFAVISPFSHKVSR